MLDFGSWEGPGQILGEQPVKTVTLDFRPAELLEDTPLLFTPEHVACHRGPEDSKTHL